MAHYLPGEHYQWHFDGFVDDGTPEMARTLSNGGNRKITALLYLNDVPDKYGGRTEFESLEETVQPRKGSVLIFENLKAGESVPHDDSVHRGAQLTGGEKWIANLWFREKATYRGRG